MAAGRPVILAIDGVIRQVVEAAQGGVFVPPGDAAALAQAIRALADDPQRAREMGAERPPLCGGAISTGPTWRKNWSPAGDAG